MKSPFQPNIVTIDLDNKKEIEEKVRYIFTTTLDARVKLGQKITLYEVKMLAAGIIGGIMFLIIKESNYANNEKAKEFIKWLEALLQ
jgi:hypothetical protein